MAEIKARIIRQSVIDPSMQTESRSRDAYGWDDLAAAVRYKFLLDYDEEDDDEPGVKKSKAKEPWRFRWPDEFRDEVPTRLLELNELRHQEELLAGKSDRRGEIGPRRDRSCHDDR